MGLPSSPITDAFPKFVAGMSERTSVSPTGVKLDVDAQDGLPASTKAMVEAQMASAARRRTWRCSSFRLEIQAFWRRLIFRLTETTLETDAVTECSES